MDWLGQGRPGQNGTSVLKSTGGFKQRAVSPCTFIRSLFAPQVNDYVADGKLPLLLTAAAIIRRLNSGLGPAPTVDLQLPQVVLPEDS